MWLFKLLVDGLKHIWSCDSLTGFCVCVAETSFLAMSERGMMNGIYWLTICLKGQRKPRNWAVHLQFWTRFYPDTSPVQVSSLTARDNVIDNVTFHLLFKSLIHLPVLFKTAYCLNLYQRRSVTNVSSLSLKICFCQSGSVRPGLCPADFSIWFAVVL